MRRAACFAFVMLIGAPALTSGRAVAQQPYFYKGAAAAVTMGFAWWETHGAKADPAPKEKVSRENPPDNTFVFQRDKYCLNPGCK